MEMSSNETIKQAVIAGIGVSFSSLRTVGPKLRSGLIKVLDIADTPVTPTWHVVRLASKVLSLTVDAFHYFAIKQGAGLLRADDESLLVAAAQTQEPVLGLRSSHQPRS
jgi:LysR family transcriptional regulator, low CO2-responsive transcriptional regulator